MARIKITHRPQGYDEIRTAPKVIKMLNEIAERVADRAGSGFEARAAEVVSGGGGPRLGVSRGRAAVVTTTHHAMRAQARDHVLEKALGGDQDA